MVRYCSIGSLKPRISRASFQTISRGTNQLCGHRNRCVALSLFDQRYLWTSALSFSQPPIWRRTSHFVRHIAQYGGRGRQQTQALNKEWEQKRDAQIEQLAARVYAFLGAKISPELRRSAKSRRVYPLNTKFSQLPQIYLWAAKAIQDVKDTAHVVYISRQLVLGFGAIFSFTWLLFHLEISYDVGNYSEDKLNTKIAHWLRSFSKALQPHFPDDGDPLLMGELMGQRPCDWLQSPVSLIPQLANGFACLYLSGVWNSSLLVLALAPLLKQAMSSRHIIFAYIAGGFLASNIVGAVMYLSNPSARFSAAELQNLLDSIPPSLYERPFREWLRDSKLYELQVIGKDATVMVGAGLEEEAREVEAKMQKKKREIEGLGELESVFEYTGRSLGTSSAITCLGECASSAAWLLASS